MGWRIRHGQREHPPGRGSMTLKEALAAHSGSLRLVPII
jgi:hypothetical protein